MQVEHSYTLYTVIFNHMKLLHSLSPLDLLPYIMCCGEKEASVDDSAPG